MSLNKSSPIISPVENYVNWHAVDQRHWSYFDVHRPATTLQLLTDEVIDIDRGYISVFLWKTLGPGDDLFVKLHLDLG